MRNNVVSIDLGGTSIKYALVSPDYELLFTGSLPTHAEVSRKAVIEQLYKAVKNTLDYAAAEQLDVAAVGIGSPGLIDPTGTTVLGGADNLPDWRDLPLAELISAQSGLPVFLDNDANLMGRGEMAAGAGKGCSDLVFLTIGTGIGGAVFVQGKLVNGFANRGGELGHIPLFVDGEACSCGSNGCFEQYASTSALVNRYKKQLARMGLPVESDLNGKEIVSRYFAGEKAATEVLEEHCYLVGRGVAAYINIFSPEKVVIGGGISEAGDFYIRLISEAAFRHAMPDCALNTRVEAAHTGGNAGCIGGAHLAFEKLNQTICK